MKEYVGCVYHLPPKTRTHFDELTVDEIRDHVVDQLPGVPVWFEHASRDVIGDVTRAWQRPGDGSLYVGFRLRESPKGLEANELIAKKQYLGLSLGTYRPMGPPSPIEVSLCQTPRRPLAYIENASSSSKDKKNINPISFTTPVNLPLEEMFSSSQLTSLAETNRVPIDKPGVFDNVLNTEEKMMLDFLHRKMGFTKEGMPPSLQQTNPLEYERSQQQERDRQAQQNAVLQQQHEEEILRQAAAIVKQRQPAVATAPPTETPPPVAAAAAAAEPMDISPSDAGRALGSAKRKAQEEELADLKKQLEQEKAETAKKAKTYAYAMFADIEDQMRKRGQSEEDIAALKKQVEEHHNPVEFLQSMKRFLPPIPPAAAAAAAASPPAAAAAPMETTSNKAEAAAPPPAVASLDAIWAAIVQKAAAANASNGNKDASKPFDTPESAMRIIEEYQRAQSLKELPPTIPMGLVQASAAANPKLSPTDQNLAVMSTYLRTFQNMFNPNLNGLTVRNKGPSEPPEIFIRKGLPPGYMRGPGVQTFVMSHKSAREVPVGQQYAHTVRQPVSAS